MVESISMETIELYPKEFFHYRLKFEIGGDSFRSYIGNVSEYEVLAIVPEDRYNELSVNEAVRGRVEARSFGEFFFSGRIIHKQVMEIRNTEVRLVRVKFDDRIPMPVDLMAVIMAIGD